MKVNTSIYVQTNHELYKIFSEIFTSECERNGKNHQTAKLGV